MDTAVDRSLVAVDGLPHEDLEREVLSRVIPELRSGAWRLRSWRVTRVLERPPTRILFSVLSHEDRSDNRARTAKLVAKVYGDDNGGARAMGALRQLWEAGFRPPARHQVPRPYGYAAAWGALVQAEAPGVLWADVLGNAEPSLVAASAQAADWLIALQRSPVRAECDSWRGDVALVEHCVRELAAAFPRHARRLQPPAERLWLLLRAGDTAPVPSHGDYHPENVFLAPGLTTVVDFDTLGLREPAFDVGWALGQLLTMSYLRLGALAPGARAALAFWRRYEREGRAPWSRVTVHAVRSLLRSLHYELCTLRNDRVDLLAPWIDLMEVWQDSRGPATLEGLACHGSD